MAAEPGQGLSTGRSHILTELTAPSSEEELIGLVARAAANAEPLAIYGGGTRGAIGGRTRGTPLSTSGMSGITRYEPAEMIFSARAGTPLAEVEAALAEKGQMLPFEPMDHRPMLGTTGTPTIGAVAAGNISGPRRFNSGAARDHLIGVRLVNGNGELVRNGGRVMKNVTGLDLVKLSAGSFGTLGMLTEVTFKVLPLPQASTTLCLEGIVMQAALEAMADALATPFEVCGAAFLDASEQAPSRLLFRIEGFADSCAYRAGRLADHLAAHGRFEDIGYTPALWSTIGNAEAMADPELTTVLRVHVAPSKAVAIVDIGKAVGSRLLLDWGGGLIWLGLTPDIPAGEVMKSIAAHGGHPMVVRSSDETLTSLPQANAAIVALARRVKHAFDPKGIFNPDLLPGHI